MCATASGQRRREPGQCREAPEGNTCKGNVLMPMEATWMADRLQGSESGSGRARVAKRPQPQGK